MNNDEQALMEFLKDIDSLKEISNFLQYPLMIYFQGKKSLLLHKRIVNKESIILEIWYLVY